MPSLNLNLKYQQDRRPSVIIMNHANAHTGKYQVSVRALVYREHWIIVSLCPLYRIVLPHNPKLCRAKPLFCFTISLVIDEVCGFAALPCASALDGRLCKVH